MSTMRTAPPASSSITSPPAGARSSCLSCSTVPHRFSELARTIGGVSEKMLAQTLQTLEADGLLARAVYPTIPPKVEYSLTPLGHQAALHVRTLTNWVEENVAQVLKHQANRTA